MSKGVAIIGISGRYPLAANIAEFYKRLSAGTDCVRPMTDARKSLYEGSDLTVGSEWAAIDNIESFDYEFFGMSRKEAEFTDPQHRILLQLSCQAIESAGYKLSDFRGSETGVFISAANQDYRRLFDDLEPTAVIGNLPAALAGRIAYELDLQGASIVYDTACSSSLVAIYEAYRKVSLNEVEYALAGGINIFFLEDALGNTDIGIMSPDGRAKAFAAGADGTGFGEGGGLVLLKNLERAIADNDNIWAVIRGGAVNQDGGRSNGLTAPSPEAQTQVILDAWKDAQINPETITFIETHGTGTKLGDPIEIQGISDAFRKFTDKKRFCEISSVKTNIGHLVAAAGIAGLTKCVLSLSNKKLFKSLHFDKPNELIDFENSPVKVTTEFCEWQTFSPDEPLRCGVSSFGLSGTNAHLVLEEALSRKSESVTFSGEILIKISAKSGGAVREYAGNLAAYLSENSERLEDAAFTINLGRDDYAFRFAFVAKDKTEAVSILRDLKEIEISRKKEYSHLVYLFPQLAENAQRAVEFLENSIPVFQIHYQECLEKLGEKEINSNVYSFIYQYCLYQTLSNYGLKTTTLIGSGLGNKVVGVLTGRLSLEQALSESFDFNETVSLDTLKLKSLLSKLLSKGETAFLSLGGGSELSQNIQSILNEEGGGIIYSSDILEKKTDFLNFIGKLYQDGFDIDWKAFYKGENLKRVSAPTYPFENKKCWVKAKLPSVSANQTPAGETVQPPETGLNSVLQNQDATGIEQRIANIWQEILSIDQLDLEDDYFDLGGDSLTGTQLINAILKEFKVKIEFEDVYTYSTVRSLGEYLVALGAESSPNSGETAISGIAKISREGKLPLSSGQERLWFLNQLEPENPFYNISLALDLQGKLDVQALENSLSALIERHEVLRTAFLTVEGKPKVEIKQDLEVFIQKLDLRGCDSRHKQLEAGKIAVSESQKPFDLTAAPLFRVSLIALDEARHLLVIVMHHIISDGWSIGVLVRDFAAFYQAENGKNSLPELTVQYADYANWQKDWLNGVDGQKQISYWKTKLDGNFALLELPADHPRPAIPTYRGERYDFSIPSEITFGFGDFLQKHDLTLFMFLLASFQILLQRFSGQHDILVGSPIAGRNRAELENIIGFFTNTLVFRADFRKNPNAKQFLQDVKNTALEAYANQNVPFEKLVDVLQPARMLNVTPLFQVMFVLQNLSFELVKLKDLTMEVTEPERHTSKFDMTLFIREAENGFLGRVEYSADLFSAETIENLVGKWFVVLRAIMSDSDVSVSSLPLFSQTEEIQIINRYNSPAVPFATTGVIHRQFEDQVRQTPELTAVVAGGQSLSFEELNRRSNKLANYLRSVGVGIESRVAILLGRETDLIVSVLGILKAGAAFVPLDLQYPSERIAFIIRDAGAGVLLTRSEYISDLKINENYQTVGFDYIEDSLDSQSSENLTVEIDEHNLAYILYTSGSTGRPKGVMIEHRSVINLYYALHESIYSVWKAIKRVSLNSPLVFDASIKQLIQMMFGKTIYIVPEEIRGNPAEIIDYLNLNSIDVFDCTPSIAQFLTTEDDAKPFPKFVLVGGEPVIKPVWDKLSVQYPTRFYNVYGPTETTVDAAVAEISKTIEQPTIGKGIANVRLYVLDEGLRMTADGVRGELYIGGAGVGRGYLHQSGLTAEKFVPDPYSPEAGSRMYASGDLVRWVRGKGLEYLGRKDGQVKVRGYRIETGEVEAALRRTEWIREAAVVAKAVNGGGRQLVGYVVANESGALETEKDRLRRRLAEELPSYMIPSEMVELAELPQTRNGKIDRKRLELLPLENTGERADNREEITTDEERQLKGIWEEVLQKKNIGRHDNFFHLGGDSIISIQIVSKANQNGFYLKPRQLFQFQTIYELARAANRKVEIDAEQGLVTGEVLMTPIQKWFFEGKTVESISELNHWNQSVLLKTNKKLCPEIIEKVLSSLVAHHDILRSRFVWENGNWTQRISDLQTPKLYEFETVNLAGLSDSERAGKIESFSRISQTGLNIGTGTIFKVVLFDAEKDFQRLLIIVHHLAIDGLSWRILLEDLQSGYQQAESEKQIELASKTTSFKKWSEVLFETAQDTAIKNEFPFWEKILQKAEKYRFEVKAIENYEKFAVTISASLSRAETENLLYKVIKTQAKQINGVLIASLLTAWEEFDRQGGLYLMVESHGRETIDETIDVSRTVGWFTSTFPVLFETAETATIIQKLELVGNALDKIPEYGMNFGLLRYLTENEEIKGTIGNYALPQVSFNYLGQFDRMSEEKAWFEIADENVGDLRSPESERRYLIELGGGIVNGELQLSLRYAAKYFEKEKSKILMDNWIKSLRDLIALSETGEENIPIVETQNGDYLSEFEWEKIMTQIG